MNAPLSHTTTLTLWNAELDREERTQVNTFWFDSETEARAKLASFTEGRTRMFEDRRSCLGVFRVVQYLALPME